MHQADLVSFSSAISSESSAWRQAQHYMKEAHRQLACLLVCLYRLFVCVFDCLFACLFACVLACWCGCMFVCLSC